MLEEPNLVLLRSASRPSVWGVALSEHSWHRSARVLLRWRGAPPVVVEHTPLEKWQWVARGWPVHALLKELGIIDQMVELLARQINAAPQMSEMERIRAALDLEWALCHTPGVRPPWA